MPPPKPFFATPMHDGRVHAEFLEGMEDLLCALTRAGVPHARGRTSGISHIERARDLLHAQFLASDATILFWIDSDMGFRPQDAVDLVAFLTATGEGVVAGPYVKKLPPEELAPGESPWTFEPLPQPEPSIALEGRRYIPVRAAGTGFMALSRAAAEALSEGQPTYWAGPRRAPFRAARVYRGATGEVFYGEDFPLCARWRAIGGKVWLAADVELAHVGARAYRQKLGIEPAPAVREDPARDRLAPSGTGG